MSIFRKKPIYRNTGGGYAVDPVTGAPIVDDLPDVDVAPDGLGEGYDTTDLTPDEIASDIINAEIGAGAAEYYPGETVADLDPATLQSFQDREAAAREAERLNQLQLSQYESQLDPNSAANQRLTQLAAQKSAGSFYGAGTPGSARGAYAGALAGQTAFNQAREGALEGISGVQEKLTQGAGILKGVGDERRQYVQDVINEHIKRYNAGEISASEYRARILAMAQTLKAIQEGTATVGELSDPTQADPVESNTGGMISYNNLGGEMGLDMAGPPPGEFGMPGPELGAPSGPPMDPMMPPGPPPAPEGIIGGMPTEDPVGILAGEVEEPMSEIDKVEMMLEDLVAASDGDIKITRKKKKKGGKK